ncbi:hypothetical protein [Pseudonocardia lacus]|uniref:hypothetical protein n=1 Tax=Pseudonocardia lacus TaxID=2835865 RepID=UPI001BDBE074|nr:hypothetical protein [Pseudonocardia lacus]
MTPAKRKIEQIVHSARAAGIGSLTPDHNRLRGLAGELTGLYRQLERAGGQPALQRQIAALHKLITDVCDTARAPAPAKPEPLPLRKLLTRESAARLVPTAATGPVWNADARSPYLRYPDESGDSVRTVSGGLPGLGRRG